MPRGQGTLPADDAGRITDRRAGLEQMIRPEALRHARPATGRVRTRRCVLTFEVILWVGIAMGLWTDLSIRPVFTHARRLRVGAESPARSNRGMARPRLGVAPLRPLFAQVVRPLARPETPGAFYHGCRRRGFDGPVSDVPDSPAHAAAFSRPSAGPRGDGAFPQVQKLSLVELGTHVEGAVTFTRGQGSARAMVQALRRPLTAEMLLGLDPGSFSYELWRDLTATGVQLRARVPTSMAMRPLRTLSDGSSLAKVSRNDPDRRKDRDGLLVRVIRETLDDPQRVGHGAEHVLITTLLDEGLYPAEELIILYHERWEHALVFDEQETHQDPRRATKPAHLRGETPAGGIQERSARSLGHVVIRSLLFAAAAPVALAPAARSFTGCFESLTCRLPECDSTPPARFEAWSRGVLWEMQGARTEPRRNRINPRVIQRKMAKWKKTRPEHRQLPPLKKTFAEAIVMTC